MPKPVAIVTGASSGIGKATALRLARDFGAIALAARSEKRLDEIGLQVREIGAEPLVLALDLMAPTAAEIVVKKTLDRFGRIDALVNIAGAVAGVDLFNMTEEQWNTGMELKFHGARRLAIRAWDALKSRRVLSCSCQAMRPRLLRRERQQSVQSTRQSKRWPRRLLNAASRMVFKLTVFRLARS